MNILDWMNICVKFVNSFKILAEIDYYNLIFESFSLFVFIKDITPVRYF